MGAHKSKKNYAIYQSAESADEAQRKAALSHVVLRVVHNVTNTNNIEVLFLPVSSHVYW